MIFGVSFKVGGEALDFFAQERNLNFGGSRVSLMYPKLLNYFVSLSCLRHVHPFLIVCLVNLSPITRRFLNVKVIKPERDANCPVAIPPAQPVHRLATEAALARSLTRALKGHAGHLADRDGAVWQSGRKPAMLDNH
jgi:hypothetical protein